MVTAMLAAASVVVTVRVPLTDCDDPESRYRSGVGVFIAGVEAIAARLSAGPNAG